MDFSLRALEYDRLKKLLGRYVTGEGALELLAAVEPIRDREVLEDQHALNREAMDYLREHRVSFSDIPLLGSLVGKLDLRGVTLDVSEVEALQDFLGQAEGFRTRWKSDAGDFPLLAARARRFPDLRELGSLLGRAVRRGEINEDYSPTLKRLRRAAETARSRLNRKLEGIIKSPELSNQLQDQLITIRNGRYVIPVRAEQKRTFDGIMHGSSSSGATVFMEPLDTLELNNEIVRLEEEQQREIQRILGELTDRIQEQADDLHLARELWSEMELVFGRCRFGRDFDCVAPTFSGKRLHLEEARHPLLEDNLRPDRKPVPLNLDMDDDDRVLVISGPNAGGKTVVLKTLGMLSLMAQSGIPLPAAEAVLPIMDRVLADIGDQQSITNQLSTFSAHVLAIKDMAETASANSLILLDEIGSSTEPAEGAALATAILEHFRSVGSLTLASTHYNRLKMYAETRQGVRNAAMEFDEETLEPTYRLIDGLVGSSSGLKIAERFGFPRQLLAEARESLDDAELQAARYVDELKIRIENLEREKSELESERNEFQTWKGEMTQKAEEERGAALDRVEERLDSIVADIRDRAAAELATASKEAAKRFERKLADARARASREIRRELRPEDESKVTTGTEGSGSKLPQAGDRVRVVSLGVSGPVSRVLKREVEVTLGNMKVRRPISDIEIVEEADVKLPDGVHFDFSEKHLESIELNLIGCTAEEAVSRLDKFLDDAFLSGAPMVRVIHGFGMGVLRKAVAEFLENHPHVARFESAPQSQGGGGATIATLKE